MPTPDDQSCDICAYFNRVGSAGEGYCVRHPPIPVVMVQALSADQRIESRWPDVLATDWCGEFRQASAGPPA